MFNKELNLKGKYLSLKLSEQNFTLSLPSSCVIICFGAIFTRADTSFSFVGGKQSRISDGNPIVRIFAQFLLYQANFEEKFR